ncbi:hypothetical protein [Streptococcus entericus]|uniref:hypothetical protein n=1 Tax=Streptococcus entericus TaxID=155680 RepID=UPI0003A80174|nr:hypothetical protein [Streptococcus entericus]
MISILNTAAIARTVRRLHLFDAKHPIKTSSFDHYTLDLFQNGEQVTVEIYSSYPWFEGKTLLASFPTKLDKGEVSVFWKHLELEKEAGSIETIMLAVDINSEDGTHRIYDGYLVNSQAVDIDDFFTLQDIDTTEHPSKVD